MIKPILGQEAAVERSGRWSNICHLGYSVIHVTPTGKCTIKRHSDGYTCKFNADGYEVGADKYRADRVRFDCDAIRLSHQREQQSVIVANLINEVKCDCRSTYDKGSMERIIAELQVRIDRASAALQALQ